jgi:hypothetical protein
MTLVIQDLYDTFCERTRWTNYMIETGFASRLGIFEETITDVNLAEIWHRHPDHVLTKKFSRRQEGSESGADWLWCIGEPGSWLSLLIQAKVVNPANSICYQLNYQSGQQRDLLVKFAHQHKLLPLYCVYNHIAEGTRPPAKAAPSLSGIDPSEWACALLIPKHVKTLTKQDKRKQIDILNYGIPWTYPFHYAATSEQPLLAEALAEAIGKVRADFDELERRLQSRTRTRARTINQPKIRVELDNPDPSLLVTSDLPKIVLDLVKGKINPLHAPVGGVSIVSKIPIRPYLEQRGALPAPTDDLWALTLNSEEEEEQLVERRRRRS